MNAAVLQQFFQFLEQNQAMQHPSAFGASAAREEDIARLFMAGYQPNGAFMMNAPPSASTNSTTSSLRSSPTSSMMSSGPTSPLQPLQLPASVPMGPPQKKKSGQSTRQSRAAHNELEKNRRANLRSYLDQIKTQLPPEYDSSRDTTLSLLTRARNHLRDLNQRQTKQIGRRNDLVMENSALRQKIEKLKEIKRQRDAEKAQKEAEEAAAQDAAQAAAKATELQARTLLAAAAAFMPVNFSVTTTFGGNSQITFNPFLEGLLPLKPLCYPYNYLPVPQCPTVNNSIQQSPMP